jgi:hypothetical protein
MRYYSQGEFGKKIHKPLITVWRWCRSGKIKVKIFEVYQKVGLVQMPLIPETELKKFSPIDN